MTALQKRMSQLEGQRAQMRQNWEREREGLMRELDRYRLVLKRYSIPAEEAAEMASLSRRGPGFALPSSLDAKMQRLNGLLLQDPPARRRTGSLSDVLDCAGSSLYGDLFGPGDTPAGSPLVGPGVPDLALDSPGLDDGDLDGDKPLGARKIVNTLQAMFPHATIRSKDDDRPFQNITEAWQANGNVGGGAEEHVPRRTGAMLDEEVWAASERLERLTSSEIDERALQSLQCLNVALAREALGKVEDLVESQGGRCRNLSSILQSVCRKLERRSGGGRSLEDGPADVRAETRGAGAGHVEGGPGWREQTPDYADDGAADRPPASRREGRRERRRRRRGLLREDSEGDGSSRDENLDEHAADPAHASGSPRGGRGRRAQERTAPDPTDEDEDEELEGHSSGSRSRPYWATWRVEKAAQRGFELHRGHGERWELKLAMASIDPPLTEAAMKAYCQWLRTQLSSHRDKYGPRSLRNCCAEVDFSNNGLGDNEVWMLLEALLQQEVHVSILKLYKNRITSNGVLAMCEFIRNNKRCGAVHELHLSHNEIDDEAALELLRTLFKQRPRYPARRPVDGDWSNMAPVPVWLRLNQNRVKDPNQVLRVLQAEGITSCAARVTFGCSPTRCSRSECPLLHLYLFTDQVKEAANGSIDALGDTQAGVCPRHPSREVQHSRDRGWAGGSRSAAVQDGAYRDQQPESEVLHGRHSGRDWEQVQGGDHDWEDGDATERGPGREDGEGEGGGPSQRSGTGRKRGNRRRGQLGGSEVRVVQHQ